MTDRVPAPRALLQRVREEYRESKNLRLTPAQAQRLFDLDPLVCGAILDALVNENFLSRTSDGLFVQAATSP